MDKRFFACVVLVAIWLGALGVSALADHTNPRKPLSPPTGVDDEGITQGKGRWRHLRNFQANPGTDLEFFKKRGVTFSTSGTLGQADEAHVGQRILRLVTARGRVRPKLKADHGSANCPTANPAGTTGLQHDSQVTPKRKPQLIVDTTDATGRCHDPGGGGLELIDVRGIRTKGFKPREVHLTRHDGTSHNSTVDATRPWIIYNSNSDEDRPWIDVVDIRSCLGFEKGTKLARKRRHCRPKVYRMPFRKSWTAQKNADPDDGEIGKLEDPYGCHDITARRNRLYCAAINGTAIFNVKGLTTRSGRIKGKPLPCKVTKGTLTRAKVTDCDLSMKGQGSDGNDPAAEDAEAYKKLGSPRARGWRFLGSINHPGRESGNTNAFVRSDEGVALSHEADPLGRRFMAVTDERGGGVVPPGASCTPGADNPIGNGGLHIFDISNPARPVYARTPEGKKAIFISDRVTPVPTFCNIHVIEKIPGEQRIIMAWYSQGIKVVDYFIDNNGRWTFDEVASYTLPNANTWAAEDFKIKNHSDGTRTYFFLASDIDRGIDIVRWRGPTNRG